eukprot:jgi/Mesen1/9423/ME000618S08812
MGSSPLGVIAFRRLLRAQRVIFKGDDFARSEAMKAIRSGFDENRHVSDPQEIQRLAGEAHEAAEFLRLNVVQAKLNSQGNYEMKLQEEHAGAVAQAPSEVKPSSRGTDLGPLT